jgi:hypothetical protein
MEGITRSYFGLSFSLGRAILNHPYRFVNKEPMPVVMKSAVGFASLFCAVYLV